MLKNNHILFIVNPISGIKNNQVIAKQIIQILNDHHITVDTIYTKHKNYAKEYVLNMKTPLYTSILILGGDGTINEILNGILLRKDRYLPIFGFLPGGTGNSVLHDLNYLDPISALAPILNNSIKYIDVMSLTFNHHVEYSINILGWGLVSDIAILAEKLRFIGQIRYDLASLYYIMKLKARDCQLIIDNKLYHDKYIFILIQNTIHTGKGMKAAPNAILDDGLLDIVFVNQEANRFELIKLLAKLSSGTHIQSEYVQYKQVHKIKLLPTVNEAVNIDGDVKNQTPVEVSVLSKKLPIYY
jgi:diacylglycerol kinase (ATP)